MIIDLQAFIREEQEYWTELEQLLSTLEQDISFRMDLRQVQHFHYLYRRATADLARLTTFACERELQQYLESLVGRAYAEIHQSNAPATHISPLHWFWHTFPQTFRRHIQAFMLSLAITLAGFGFGALALTFDPQAKAIVMPFEHLLKDPTQRVAEEEKNNAQLLEGHQATFAATLMRNNIRVSIFNMALGLTWGVGTIILLFYNGLIVGGVAADYILGGQTTFLLGWLLPHGSIEIPAIIISGQAGLIMASALIGGKKRQPLRTRLAGVLPDLVTFVVAISLMLVWAGLIESFFSQYHEPRLPYWVKILFGSCELGLLLVYLGCAGRTPVKSTRADENHA